MTTINTSMPSIYRMTKTTAEDWRIATGRQGGGTAPFEGEKKGNASGGTRGNDTISVYDDAVIRAGAGDDEISAYSNATIHGGKGSDYISAYDHASVRGGQGNDIIDTYGDAVIWGGAGNDEIWTYANSTVDGGAGDDLISGYGNSNIAGGDGNDHVSVYDHSTVKGGAGNDWVDAYDFAVVDGGDGNDVISVYRDSTVDGGAGNDRIETYERATVSGGKGADEIVTGGGAIIKYAAGDGRDHISLSGTGTLELGEGISPDTVEVTVKGNTATISINGNPDDVITVDLYAWAPSSLTIAFADGSTREVNPEPSSGGRPDIGTGVVVSLPSRETPMSGVALATLLNNPDLTQAEREHLVGTMAPVIYPDSVHDHSSLAWKKLPPGSAQPMTAELKAEIAAREAHVRQMQADYDAETAANPDFYNPRIESNGMYLSNVATLPADEVQPRIDYVTRLIESGEAENYSFQSGNGDQSTTSIHQYLYWLQQRAHTFGDGG